MRIFPVGDFADIIADLTAELGSALFQAAKGPGTRLGLSQRRRISKHASRLVSTCNSFDCRASVSHLRSLYNYVSGDTESSGLNSGCLSGVVASKLQDLISELCDEFGAQKFIVINPDRSALVWKKDPFGKAVNKSFPAVYNECIDAQHCLAVELHTAAVIHSMRVLEVALRKLHKRLKLPKPKNPNWEHVIREIETEIKRRDALNPRPKSWKRDNEFYHDAARHFRFFKDVRNRETHINLPVDKYPAPDRDKALKIFEAVKDFMQHLATKM